jgi:hypothetical protein
MPRRFSSTFCTLDAFQSSYVYTDTATIDAVLVKAWEEDLALNLEDHLEHVELHDGKGDKELFFYRHV